MYIESVRTIFQISFLYIILEIAVTGATEKFCEIIAHTLPELLLFKNDLLQLRKFSCWGQNLWLYGMQGIQICFTVHKFKMHWKEVFYNHFTGRGMVWLDHILSLPYQNGQSSYHTAPIKLKHIKYSII